MLPCTTYGDGELALVMVPFLGGSQREWTEVVDLSSVDYRCITSDLPGFGAASGVPGFSVEEMADAIVDTLSSMDLGDYVLIGHSMAGKVFAVVTRKLLNRQIKQPKVRPPSGLVLVAPSPPGPEPMSDSKRTKMLASLGNEKQLQLGRYSHGDRSAAEAFVQDNIAHALSQTTLQRTVDDVLKMNPAAWVAWLEHGSKEDWSSFVGTLDLPALIVSGTRDGALGPDAQRQHTLPHFSDAKVVEVDCSHLIPLEAPGELATLISNFLVPSTPGIHL